MIAVVAGALAGGILGGTAETLDPGQIVLRLPTGRSAVGIGERSELWVVPLDLGIGGPRLGLEQGFGRGDLRASVRPSVGLKHTLHRASLRVDGLVTWSTGVHALSAELSVDARFLRTTKFSRSPGGAGEVLADARREHLAFDRVQSHLVVTWDLEDTVRARVRLPLRDRGHTLRWGSGSVGWVHQAGPVHLVLGAGMLVGRPTDAVTLDTYRWWFWLPYPELDLALAW